MQKKEQLEMAFSFSMPTEWYLPLSSAHHAIAGEQSQGVLFNGQQIYLNSLCLNSFLPWFRAEYDAMAQAWLPPDEQRSLWSMVSGSAMILGASHGSKRLVLLPTEASDTAQLEIPQEWVEIPSWAADYFLAVQVDPEEEWLLVWGYVTHQQVQQQGEYEGRNRTYWVDAAEMTPDLNALWMTLQHCPDAVTQGEMAPLPTLDSVHSQNLIQRLGNRNLAFARLAVPFLQWGALLDQPTDRCNLARQRSGQAPTVLHRLGQWFQAQQGESQMIAGWQQLSDSLRNDQPRLATHFRHSAKNSSKPGAEANVPTIQRVKQLCFSPDNITPDTTTAENAPVVVWLLLKITTEPDNRLGIIAQLHPGQRQPYLPTGIKLSLIPAPDAPPLQSVQSQTADNYIQLNRFRCSPETQFQLTIQLEQDKIIESFVV